MSIGTKKSLGRFRTVALSLGFAAALSACAPIVRHHGYIPPEIDLAQISVGRDTRESVLETLGSPSSAGMMDASGIYYVSSEFRTVGPMAPREVNREVLSISFDSNGRVANIERFGLENGRVIVLSRRVTDDNVRDTTLIRQLLGNLGRVGAGQFVGAPRE